MREIGIGIIGGGYMGKAHATAMKAVGTVFETKIRPRLEMVAASSLKSAEHYRDAYGFARAAANWRELVSDPLVEAVIIATPPETHLEIIRETAKLEKPVFCEKPLGSSTEDSAEICKLYENLIHMTGFNYIRTPASQFAKELIDAGELGEITYFRGEHNEDYYADPEASASWRTRGLTNGALGDLAHVFNMALHLIGPIERLSGEIETVHKERPGESGMSAVENDDQGQFLCRFARGTMGHVSFSRIATGRKMGYAYEIFGTKGSLRFDQEDQNALWFYQTGSDPARAGFQKILAGPAHPDFKPFCLGAGHGTGYQDQITIEAKDFLNAIESGENHWCDFQAGHEANRIVQAVLASNESQAWVDIKDY